MKETAKYVSTGGIGLDGWLFLLFLTLKLTGVISWSWIWVTAPLWLGLAVTFGVIVGILAVAGIMLVIAAILDSRK